MKRILNNEELVTFFSQMGMITRSGITPFEGLSILAEEQKNEEGKLLLESMFADMEEGSSFSDAVGRTGLFPGYADAMIRLGEESGRMGDVMEDLADYYRDQEEIAGTIRRSVSYPLFMLVMMAGVLLVLMIQVMPVFDRVFESLGTGMSGPAKLMLRAGQFLSNFAGLFAVLGILLLAALVWLTKTRRGRELFSSVLKRNRMFRGILKLTYRYRLSFGLSMCLKSGLDLGQSLSLMESLMEDDGTAARLRDVQDRMAEGIYFEEAIIGTGIFDEMQNRLIRIAERTGTTDEVMQEIAVMSRNQTQEKIWKWISRIEPGVVILLSVLVGVLLLSVMLPLLGIMSQIG